MIQAYLVTSDVPLTPEETEIYLSIREEKFGIVKEYPQLGILQDDGSILSKNAELGVVKSQTDANILLNELLEVLPRHNWKIELKNYPNAQGITWYEKD
jgi:hypothetical protein